MALLPRIIATSAMLGLVACAAIAGLEEPGVEAETTKPPDRTTPSPTESSSSSNPPPQQTQNADASTPIDGSTPNDAGTKVDADANVTPPVCMKTPNGGGCTDGVTCCSGSCNEAKVCAQDCRGGGSSCDPTASAPCCVGYYCFTALCAPCIGAGGTATDKLTGGKNSKSCCSRMLAANGTQCL